MRRIVGQRPELAEMNVKRQLRLARDLLGELHHGVAPTLIAADLGMRLDALDDVAIGLGDLDGRLDVDAIGTVEARIVVALEPADDIGRDEGEDVRRRLLDDELAETRERHAAGPTLVDHRGGAGLDADHIGIEAETAADIFEDMGMGVDEAGQHQPSSEVDRLVRRIARDIAGDLGDQAALDRDVADAIPTRPRIDDPTTFEEQIVLRFHAGISAQDSELTELTPAASDGRVPVPAPGFGDGAFTRSPPPGSLPFGGSRRRRRADRLAALDLDDDGITEPGTPASTRASAMTFIRCSESSLSPCSARTYPLMATVRGLPRSASRVA